jgi:DNA replication protein DnaC
VLALLQQCLRDQGRYLDAFEVKRERLAVEQQYGLRAFIGAGRLRSRRTEQRATVRSERQSLEAIAPEIAASGRQQDLETLLQRIAGKDHKLIVLHGASGVGKSSLVNGGLLPALHARAMDNRVNVPVLIRQYTDWAGS